MSRRASSSMNHSGSNSTLSFLVLLCLLEFFFLSCFQLLLRRDGEKEKMATPHCSGTNFQRAKEKGCSSFEQ